jgi:hypothetical protein
MMSEEKSDLFEATCLDCNTTKSYFTAQGVGYFKLNHEGHRVRVREPGSEGKEDGKREARPEPAAVKEEPLVADEPAVVKAEPARKAVAPSHAGRAAETPTARGPVRLGNLVVDVVDEGKGQAVKVFGVAGGMERFTREFRIDEVDQLNAFLESGEFEDGASGAAYTWSPDKIDISMDVVKVLEEPKPAPAAREPQVEVEQEAPAEAGAPGTAPAPPQVVRTAEELPDQAQPEEVLLGKLSYIQPGDGYREESARVSKVLRKYRWNTEPPYVIGAMFDELMSIQSQTGMIKASAIEAVSKLGYDFVAIEAPAGVVTAWFRKKSDAQAGQGDEPLEFTPRGQA